MSRSSSRDVAVSVGDSLTRRPALVPSDQRSAWWPGRRPGRGQRRPAKPRAPVVLLINRGASLWLRKAMAQLGDSDGR